MNQQNPNEKDKCILCSVIVSEQAKSLCCEICDYWYHISYANIPEQIHDYAMKKGGKQWHWHCKFCK